MNEEIIIEGKENKDIIEKQFNNIIDKVKKSKTFLIFVAFRDGENIASLCHGKYSIMEGMILFEAIESNKKIFLKNVLKKVKEKGNDDCDTCAKKDNCDDYKEC